MKLQKKQQEQVIDEHHHHQYNNNKKKQQEQLDEIHKAVAQAWHSHLTNARDATSEFDARRRNFQGKPSRFKLEAINKLKKNEEKDKEKEKSNANWDFTQSLWDSYEIVAVSKKLESSLILGYGFDDLHILRENTRMVRKLRRESKNSLRSLFNKNSSRRYSDVGVSQRESSML